MSIKSSTGGFVVSFDAVLALFVVFAFLVSAFMIFSSVDDNSYNDAFLHAFSLDLLKALEVSGKMHNAVFLKDSARVDEVLERMPNYYCARIDFFEHGASLPFMSSARIDCRNVPENAFTAESFLRVDANGLQAFYTARIKSWLGGA